jgi:prophage regulatory protein
MSELTVVKRNTIRPSKAKAKLDIGLSTLWAWSKTKPDFPKPFKLSARTTVFFEDEIDAYLATQASVSRSQKIVLNLEENSQGKVADIIETKTNLQDVSDKMTKRCEAWNVGASSTLAAQKVEN